MRWEDASYVRIYTEDTPDWCAMPWQSRALLPLLLRRLDRAGFIVLGKHGVKGLAGLVRLPVEVTQEGLTGLLDDGCLVETKPGVLLMRNFVAAQSAVKSGAARVREHRRRARDEALGVVTDDVGEEAPKGEEERNETLPNVTPGNAPKQTVTPSLTEPNLSKPSQEKNHAGKPRAPELPGITSQDGQESAAAAGGEQEAQAGRSRALAGDLAALRDALADKAPARVELSGEPTKPQAIKIRSYKLTAIEASILGDWLAAGGEHFPMQRGAVLSWKILAQAGDDLRAQAVAWARNGSQLLSRAPPGLRTVQGGLTVDDKTGIKRDATGQRRGMIPLPEGY